MEKHSSDSSVSQKYWNDRIVGWSLKHYRRLRAGLNESLLMSPIERRARQSAAILNLGNNGTSSVLDLGCGIGVIAELIDQRLDCYPVRKSNGHSKELTYHGIDFSDRAIEFAQRSTSSKNMRTIFSVGNVSDIQLPTADAYLALGLTDWLKREDLRRVLTAANCKRFVISYTRSSRSMPYIIYRIVRLFLNNSTVRPQSFSKREFESIVHSCGWKIQSELSDSFSPSCLLILQRERPKN
jgi:SAM-dependent methyltransferase